MILLLTCWHRHIVVALLQDSIAITVHKKYKYFNINHEVHMKKAAIITSSTGFTATVVFFT